MKQAQWRDPNHMLVETGNKTFDRQVDAISTGNVLGHVQLSGFIRPRTRTENGLNTYFEPGRLRNFDLNGFASLPHRVREYVKSITESEAVILYEFRHWRSGRKIVHGYVITDPQDHLITKFVTGNRYKSALVIDECALYVSDPMPEPAAAQQS